jgi:hypothetical protein
MKVEAAGDGAHLDSWRRVVVAETMTAAAAKDVAAACGQERAGGGERFVGGGV